MKNRIVVFFMIISIFGCNQKTERKTDNENLNDTITKKTNSISDENSTKNLENFSLMELNNLVPMEIVDSLSNNVYEKYGLEFSGNCYSCDIANVSITEKSIILTNVCDEKQNKTFNIINIAEIDNRIEIKTKSNEFIFTKIENEPIYKFRIIGKTIEFDNLRFALYYTLEKILNKFKQHDCGDFQG